jgi:hypothetical protein
MNVCDCNIAAVWFATAAYVCLKKNCCMTLSDRLTCVCLMWLQPGEYEGLQNPLQCGCNLCCAAIAKKQLQKQHVCDLQPCHSVIATPG